jgi:hypothetical protein
MIWLLKLLRYTQSNLKEAYQQFGFAYETAHTYINIYLDSHISYRWWVKTIRISTTITATSNCWISEPYGCTAYASTMQLPGGKSLRGAIVISVSGTQRYNDDEKIYDQDKLSTSNLWFFLVFTTIGSGD